MKDRATYFLSLSLVFGILFLVATYVADYGLSATKGNDGGAGE